MAEHGFVNKEDLHLFCYADTTEEAMEILESSIFS
jgi:hypothetical protein